MHTYIGAKAVGWSDLVDVVGVDVAVGAAGSSLPLAPTHGPAVHHAGRGGASLILLTAREWVAVVRHNPEEVTGGNKGNGWYSMAYSVPCPYLRPECIPSASQEPPGTIETPAATALLMVPVTGQQVLGR